jgi:NADPH2:quinone reductase
MAATMRAMLAEQAGTPMRLAEIARPEPQDGEVLVRVAASGVNPLDLKIAAGKAAHAKHPLPAILGLDLAGTVAAIGHGVTEFRVGDDVYGMTGGVGGVPGSLAEYAAVDARLLAKKPANLSMREAAALPLVFITAWEGLVDRVKLDGGRSVLVIGAAGGVGHVAVQIARALDAKVFALDGAGKADYLRGLGATPIDRAQPVEAYVAAQTAGRGFHVVYDCVGALDDAFKAVAKLGHVVSSLGWGTHALAPLSFKAATYSGVFTLMPLLTGEGRAEHGAILRAAARMAEAGQLKPRLDATLFTLAQANEAHRHVETRAATGKVVVTVAA